MSIYGLHSKTHKHACVPTQIQEILKSILRNHERRWHLWQQSWCDAMQLRSDTIMPSWEEILKSQAVTHIMLHSGHWAKPPININTFNLQTTKGEKCYPSFPDSSTESQVSYISPPYHTPNTNTLFQMRAFLTSTQKTLQVTWQPHSLAMPLVVSDSIWPSRGLHVSLILQYVSESLQE